MHEGDEREKQKKEGNMKPKRRGKVAKPKLQNKARIESRKKGNKEEIWSNREEKSKRRR